MLDSFSSPVGLHERYEARRRAQAAARARKAACDAEWREHLHVDAEAYASEVAQFNGELVREIRRARRLDALTRAVRRQRDPHRPAVRRPRSRGAGRPGRQAARCRSSARSGDSGSSDDGHPGDHRPSEGGRG
jgi:hypothetical protein